MVHLLIKVILLSTHKVCFGIKNKNILDYHYNNHIVWSYEYMEHKK